MMTFVLMSTKVINYCSRRGEPGYEARQILHPLQVLSLSLLPSLLSPIPASCLVLNLNILKHLHCPSPQFTQTLPPKSPPLLLEFLGNAESCSEHVSTPSNSFISERELNNQHEERCHRITGDSGVLATLCQDCQTIHNASIHTFLLTSLDPPNAHQKGTGGAAT